MVGSRKCTHSRRHHPDQHRNRYLPGLLGLLGLLATTMVVGVSSNYNETLITPFIGLLWQLGLLELLGDINTCNSNDTTTSSRDRPNGADLNRVSRSVRETRGN